MAGSETTEQAKTTQQVKATEQAEAAEQVKATTLNVVTKGSGSPPILLLHGWGQSIASLWQLGDLLSKSRTVYLIDLPGFGGSPKPQSDWGTDDYAKCILSYLHDHKLERVDVLGHSFGGRVALQMAAQEPDRIGHLLLINAAGLQRKLQGKRAFKNSFAKVSRAVCRFLDATFGLSTFENWHVPRFASHDYKNAGAMKNIFVKTVNEDLTETARKIVAPTLLLWGELDQEVPLEIANRYHELLADSKLVILPGKDHFPFANEGAHLCAYHVLKFLDRGERDTTKLTERPLSRV
jgi:pimeloyl-ACP methyl ester carboxylesterase